MPVSILNRWTWTCNMCSHGVMIHNKLWHDSLHLIISWPYQRIFAKFIFIFTDTQRSGLHYVTITPHFYEKAPLQGTTWLFMTPSVWQIICFVRLKSWWPRHLCNGLRKHAGIKTQESRLIMRTITYLDRMVAVSTPGSSGWRCLVCLSVWGWLRRRHCFRSQESHRHWVSWVLVCASPS